MHACGLLIFFSFDLWIGLQMVAPRGISDTGRGLTSLKSGSDTGRLVMSHNA